MQDRGDAAVQRSGEGVEQGSGDAANRPRRGTHSRKGGKAQGSRGGKPDLTKRRQFQLSDGTAFRLTVYAAEVDRSEGAIVEEILGRELRQKVTEETLVRWLRKRSGPDLGVPEIESPAA
jgi:hypothetical protein